MRPVRDIIVKIHESYRSKVSVGDVVFELDGNIKQVKDTVRYGEIVALPADCKFDLELGDTLYFHHGIVNITVMEREGHINSEYMINKSDGLYRIPTTTRPQMVYGRKRNGVFKALDGRCFVRPNKEKEYDTVLELEEKETECIGKMAYSSDKLVAAGVCADTMVIYARDSEYKYEIDGELLYCMRDADILALLN